MQDWRICQKDIGDILTHGEAMALEEKGTRLRYNFGAASKAQENHAGRLGGVKAMRQEY